MSLKPLRKEAMFLVVLAMVVSGAAGQGPTVFGGARFVGLSLVFLLLPPLVSASFARSAD